jgi:hypothetical protein
MAHEHEGKPCLSPQSVEQMQNDRLHADVQGSGRFVQNEQSWPWRNGARDANSGALPARKLMGKTIEKLGRKATTLRYISRTAAQFLTIRDAQKVTQRVRDTVKS